VRLPEPLPASFYARPAASVARDLLGRLLISNVGGELAVVRIVEVEAYTGPRDPACHAAGWHRSRRNEAMYGPPGCSYVYFTYGMHWCFNVVTGRAGWPAAVLVRAGEPLAGLGAMRLRRGVRAERQLASGPARLARALGIDRSLDGHPLDRPPLWLGGGTPVPPRRRRVTTRIGLSRGAERPLRFLELDSPWASR
jgi:DNA-3-methyladenine glycosylase